MNKIEVIKERVSEWKTTNTVSVELWADDVLFILSKLEIAEKALEKVHPSLSQRSYFIGLSIEVEKALEAIRGN